MKYCIIGWVIVLFAITARSQTRKPECDSAKSSVPVKAYFEGYSYKYEQNGTEVFRMERSSFAKPIRLVLTDSSYTILGYQIVADLSDGSLVSLSSDNAVIDSGTEFYKVFISGLSKASLISVDRIYIQKNNECFRVPSFICYFLK